MYLQESSVLYIKSYLKKEKIPNIVEIREDNLETNFIEIRLLFIYLKLDIFKIFPQMQVNTICTTLEEKNTHNVVLYHISH